MVNERSVESPGEEVDTYYRIYEAIWRNIDREDALVNQRIMWAVLLSTGLFAATALLANAAASEKVVSIPLRCVFLVLMIILAAIGLAFSILARQAVAAAQSQIDYLKDLYSKYQNAKRYSLFEQDFSWPRPFGDRRDSLSGSVTAKMFPVLMITIWSIAALVEFAFLIAIAAPILENFKPNSAHRPLVTLQPSSSGIGSPQPPEAPDDRVSAR